MLKKSQLIFLIVSIIIITIPRFNWGELGLLRAFEGGKPFDVEQYIKYTEYFSGNTGIASQLEGPFSYRPLVPFLASLLPFEAETSLNLINLTALILTIFVVVKLLSLFQFNQRLIFYGGLLFVFSFPVFYYGTSGYIDSVLIFFMMSSTYFLLSRKPLFFLLFFVLGITVKETMIIMIPVAAVFLLIEKDFAMKKKLIYFSTIVAVYLLETYLLRNFTPGQATYFWMPREEVLIKNLTRVKTYLSIGLTFGIAGLGALLFFKNRKCRERMNNIKYVLLTGLVFSLAVSFFSVFSAYADGRHIWTSYPFTIPLAISFFDCYKQRDSKER